MLYLIYCTDKPDSTETRMANRPAHLEFIKQYVDRVFAAGPTLSDDGETMTGSVFLIDFKDRAAAEDFCKNDPYQKAGLFDSTVIKPFRKVIP
ncbi:MAG: YciI family protein [Rhodospirillales bacterium]